MLTSLRSSSRLLPLLLVILRAPTLQTGPLRHRADRPTQHLLSTGPGWLPGRAFRAAAGAGGVVLSRRQTRLPGSQLRLPRHLRTWSLRPPALGVVPYTDPRGQESVWTPAHSSCPSRVPPPAPLGGSRGRRGRAGVGEPVRPWEPQSDGGGDPMPGSATPPLYFGCSPYSALETQISTFRGTVWVWRCIR